MKEGADGIFIRVALPDDIHISHRQVDRTSFLHLPRHLKQHTVTKVDGIIQAKKEHLRLILMGKICEHTFPPQARLGILPNRIHRMML